MLKTLQNHDGIHENKRNACTQNRPSEVLTLGYLSKDNASNQTHHKDSLKDQPRKEIIL